MADILRFRSIPAGERRNAEPTNAAIREATERRWTAIRHRVEMRPRISKPSERALIANNLWAILSRLEKEHGIKKVSVLRVARLGGTGTDSTKRLYTYALPSDLPAAERDRRAKTLVQKATNYIRLVEAAARYAELDESYFLEELFHGTSYEVDDEALPDEIASPWVAHLRDMLHQMAGWVVRRNRLEQYFATLIDNEVGFGITGPTQYPWLITRDNLRPNNLISFDRIEVGIPSVLLAEEEFASIDAELGSVTERPDEPCRVVAGRQLRLSVGPFGPRNASIPVFEIRIVSHVHDAKGTFLGDFEDYPFILDDWGEYHLKQTDEHGILRKGERVFLRRRGPDNDVPTDPLVSVSGCRYFRAVDLSSTFQELSTGTLDGNLWNGYYDEEQDVLTEAPPYTLAALIEKDFYREDADDRLDLLLDRRAADLVSRLDAYQRGRRDALEQAKAAARDRWKSP